MQSQVALQEEVHRLGTLVDDLRTDGEQKDQRILQQEQEILEHKQEIRKYRDMVHSLLHKQYGPSSEQTPPGQGRLFDEPEVLSEPDEGELPEPGATPRQRNGRRKLSRDLPKDLPRVDEYLDIPEHEKVCAEHGCGMARIGEEISERLRLVPAIVEVVRTRRQKYTCPQCEGNVVTAKMPPQPIPKSIATPELLSSIITSKYVDGMPLYRQSDMFGRMGVSLDRTTMANWMIKCGKLTQPLINLLWDIVREQPLIHMDETTVQVLAEPDRKPETKSYMWVAAAGPPGASAVLFYYDPSRGGGVPERLLNGYRGALMVDGHEPYEVVCGPGGARRLGCWAHARRKVVEAVRAQPKGKSGKPNELLKMINWLYRIERAIRDADEQTRYRMRQEQSRPVIEKLRKWLDKSLPGTLPESPLGKALTYLNNQWPRLVGYLEDGSYPIDNNRAENAIRPFVVGRKNWLFSQSERGAEASANLYSLVETAKANGLNPHTYLSHVLTEIPKVETADDYAALLPGNLKDAI